MVSIEDNEVGQITLADIQSSLGRVSAVISRLVEENKALRQHNTELQRKLYSLPLHSGLGEQND